MTGLFRGKWLQLWTYGPPAAAETSFGEACATAREWGFDGVLAKAMDGELYMGHFDPSGSALHSIDQVLVQQTIASGYGLRYGCWVNPLHGDRGLLLREAELYAQIGALTGLLAWDTEPYGSFYGAGHPPEDAAALMDRFRELAPSCVNIWQPDPRRPRLADLGAGFAPNMNVFSGQDYWTDFGRPAGETLSDTLAVFGEMVAAGQLPADAEFAPTLPGNADPADLDSAFGLLRANGVQALIVWRLGSAGPDQLGAFKRLQLVGPTTAPAPTPCTLLRNAVLELIGQPVLARGWRDRFRALAQAV